MRMTDAGMTQDNFILPAPPVGGLPISQEWLDRMSLVHDKKQRYNVNIEAFSTKRHGMVPYCIKNKSDCVCLFSTVRACYFYH